MANPKLALIPSAYKAGTLYSPLPTNGDGDFTFTRNSVATRVNKDGLIEDVAINIPRLDYSDGGCPSLLLEPQRTNLITYSEDFADASWAATNSNVEASNEVSPIGNLDATKIIPTTVSGVHQIRVNLSTVDGTFTQSIFAKQGGYKNILLWDDTTSSGIGVNLDDLSIFRNQNTLGYNIESLIGGWVRISVSYSLASQTLLSGIYIYDNSPTPQITFSGDGTSGIHILGTQVEEGSYATSYIPTNGSITTRVVELCSLDTSFLGLSDITETFADNTTNVITSIPTTYNVTQGKISKIIGE